MLAKGQGRLSPGVYLVGAGPGDPDLMTVKGLRYLGLADVVVYDDLVAPQLLDHARPDSARVFVGPRHTPAHLTQTDINQLLVQHFQAALATAGVPYEVVPGVTAALAAGAAAGIPLTDRRASSMVTFVTGHECEDTGGGVDWNLLAQLGGTIAVFMGMRSLRAITRRLLAGGRAVSEPVAVITSATTAAERIVVGTLETIVHLAATEGITAPAMILIGPVVNLRPQAGALRTPAARQECL